MDRRQFLKRSGILAGGAALAGAQYGVVYSLLLEPFWPRVTRTNVNIRGLPDIANGLRICQLSDFHVGPYVRGFQIENAVGIANREKPDVVVLTGDFVSKHRRFANECAEALAGLDPPLGIYATLGNHDFWTDAEYVASALRNVGITVLRDEKAELLPGLWFAGMDDWWEGSRDISGVVRSIPESDSYILLQHNPDIILNPEAFGRSPALILSGHTHGGQVNIPGIGAPLVPTKLGSRYASGMFDFDGVKLYVTRGLGGITPPVRFNCPPEVAILTLRATK
ncbi:MAG: metallophosphoesterase [bacterium]|nr:metallophosphoesterase [bacterium]